MITVYNSKVDAEVVSSNLNRLTSQIFRLLPANEEGQD